MQDSSRLTVLARWDHDLATIVLRGELDVTSASRAQRCLGGLLGQHPRRLVIDLAGLTFMDTQGVELIAQARRGLPAGGDVTIRGANPSIRRVLTITGIDKVCILEEPPRPPVPDTQIAP